MSEEMQGVENSSATPDTLNLESSKSNDTQTPSSGLTDGHQRETNAVVPPFLLHYADVWHPVFSSIADDKISKAVSSGFIPSDTKFGSILLEGRGAEFLSQPLNRILEEIEGIFSIENDVSLEIPALAPLVFNINNSFCEDLTISDVHFAHTGAAGASCPIVARLLIEPHHFASVWNTFVQGAESLGEDQEESHHEDAMDVDHDQNQHGDAHVLENFETAVSQDSIPVTAVAPSVQDETAEEQPEIAEPVVDDIPAPNTVEAALDGEHAEEQDSHPLEPTEEMHADEIEDDQESEQPDTDPQPVPVEEPDAVDSIAASEIDAESGATAAEDVVPQDAEADVSEHPDAPDEADQLVEAQEDGNDDELNELDELPDGLDSGVEVPDDLGDLEAEFEAADEDAQNSKKRSRDDSHNGTAELDHEPEDSELQETEPKRLKKDAEPAAVVDQAVAAN